MTPQDYEYLRKLLKDQSGLDLSVDKQYLLESRLVPLSRKAGLAGIPELVQKMKAGSASLTAQVVEAMTTNESFFFRDKTVAVVGGGEEGHGRSGKTVGAGWKAVRVGF